MAPTKRKVDGDGGAPKKKLQRRNATTAAPSERRTTRLMTTDASRQAVFATAELLENIMLHLPAKTIYASQRVCRQFRDIVKTSVALQQKLFIRPTLPDDKVWELRKDSDLDDWAWTKSHFVSVAGSTSFLEAKQLRPVQLNPVLTNSHPWANSADRLRWDGSVERIQVIHAKCLKYQQVRDLGLWASSQLTDPPSRWAVARLYWTMKASGRKKVTGRLDATIDKTGGVTVGDVWDALMNAKADNYQSGSQYHNVEDSSFTELHDRLLEERYKPAVFNKDDLFVELHAVALPSEEEWETVRSEQKGANWNAEG